MDLKQRNEIVRRLCKRANSNKGPQKLTPAQFNEAIRCISEQIRDELLESDRERSDTLNLINQSMKKAKKSS